MVVKNRLKYWRKRLKTQEEFARFTGFTQSNISHWEKDRVRPENALQIMNKLKVVFSEIHLEDLYVDTGDH